MSKKCKYENCDNLVFGQGYCSFHYPKKAIKKYSEKGIEKKRIKTETTRKLHQWFIDEIWDKRKHNCESCGFWLGKEPKTTFFDHLIEKSKRKDLAFEKENIFLCCENCHNVKNIGFPTAKHAEAIKTAIQKYGKKLN